MIKYFFYLSKANTVSLFNSLALKEPNSIIDIDRNSFKVLSIIVIFGTLLLLKSLGSALMNGVPGNKYPRILNVSITSFFQQFGLSVHAH